jgi:hypothetical protein
MNFPIFLVLRLICEAPEVKGLPIETLDDLVPKEGVDIITRRADNLPAFWEVKHVKNIDAAINLNQIEKHLRTKILSELTKLRDAGFERLALRSEMSKIRLKYNVVVEKSASLKDDGTELLNSVNYILAKEFPELAKAGFKFEKKDIYLREAKPLLEKITSLPARFLGL